jgi:hypothetical protein
MWLSNKLGSLVSLKKCSLAEEIKGGSLRDGNL